MLEARADHQAPVDLQEMADLDLVSRGNRLSGPAHRVDVVEDLGGGHVARVIAEA